MPLRALGPLVIDLPTKWQWRVEEAIEQVGVPLGKEVRARKMNGTRISLIAVVVECVSGKCQPDDMNGQRSKDAASNSNISSSPRYSGRGLVPF